MRKTEICVIGGGASGMAAAVTSARIIGGENVCILEKLDEPGHKILATGNGRCNLTNTACSQAEEIRQFFRELGVFTREEEDGRVYPWCGDAKAVQQALVQELKRLHVQIICGAEVTKAEAQEGKFLVSYRGGKISSRQLLLACGGKAGPKMGTTGDGAKLARRLSLDVTPLAPALTAMEVYEDVRKLKGVRAKAVVTLQYQGKKIAEEEGEVQFTAYGISGICVFNLSRKMVLPPGKKLQGGFDDYTVEIDLAGKLPVRSSDFQNLKKDSLLPLASIVRLPLAEEIYRQAEGNPERCAHLLRHFTLHPKGLKGWDMAQVTRGGIVMSELNPATMEAFAVPGLYAAGEIQDWDGPCGGFNLQHAWESGILAGRSMAERALQKAGKQSLSQTKVKQKGGKA
ncbi:MAG: aminoacetone oxidase family FAD-binding enzyme [Eubacterium sp.]